MDPLAGRLRRNDVASPVLPTEDVTSEYAYDAQGNQAAVRAPSSASGTVVTRAFYDDLGRVTRSLANCMPNYIHAWDEPYKGLWSDLLFPRRLAW